MLFLYDRPHSARFWMMGTRIALDIVFIEADGRISVIRKEIQPGSLWPVSGGKNLTAVLELNAGEAERRGIKVGDFVRHSAIDGRTRQESCGADAAIHMQSSGVLTSFAEKRTENITFRRHQPLAICAANSHLDEGFSTRAIAHVIGWD